MTTIAKHNETLNLQHGDYIKDSNGNVWIVLYGDDDKLDLVLCIDTNVEIDVRIEQHLWDRYDLGYSVTRVKPQYPVLYRNKYGSANVSIYKYENEEAFNADPQNEGRVVIRVLHDMPELVEWANV